jgi:hypothetical protein
MVKIVISHPFKGNFFQSENTKCTIFELDRNIGCQTQEKSQKMFWFGKLRHFEWMVKIMIFAKHYCWVLDFPVSMAQLPSPNFCNNFIVWAPMKK